MKDYTLEHENLADQILPGELQQQEQEQCVVTTERSGLPIATAPASAADPGRNAKTVGFCLP